MTDAVATAHMTDAVATAQEGEPGRHFYVMRTGEAAVLRSDKNGFNKADKVIDYKYAGDYFGECALLEDAPRSVSVWIVELSATT